MIQIRAQWQTAISPPRQKIYDERDDINDDQNSALFSAGGITHPAFP
jgi:hypothetical protein